MLGDRGIGENVVAAITVRHLVLAKAELVRNHGRERLDAVGVHLAELLHPAEDIVEFGDKPLELLIAHGDAGELGDVPHLFVCD